MRISASRRFIAAAVIFSTVAAVATAQRMFADIAGKWSMNVSGPQGEMISQVEIKQEGDAITGSITSEQLGTSKIEGTVKGDTVRFGFTIDAGGQSIGISAGAFLKDKDTIDGQLVAEGMGNFPFKMTRVKAPPAKAP